MRYTWAACTTVAEERISTPLGELDCLRYTVRDDGERVFWFATSLPGMPVRTRLTRGGRVVATTEVVEHGAG